MGGHGGSIWRELEGWERRLSGFITTIAGGKQLTEYHMSGAPPQKPPDHPSPTAVIQIFTDSTSRETGVASLVQYLILLVYHMSENKNFSGEFGTRYILGP